MTTGVGALVLFVADLEAATAFYRAIGIDLEDETHEDGVAHAAADVGGCHVALFPAKRGPGAPALQQAGCSFVGFTVSSVPEALERARACGAPVLQEPVEYPWGLRAVLQDPDGRPVEIFEPS